MTNSMIRLARRWTVQRWVGILLASVIPLVGQVDKPRGTFSSSGAAGSEIYGHGQLRGVLVRTTWAALEPTEGHYDFAAITTQVAQAESQGCAWSLAVAGGGVGTPDWLIDGLEVPFVRYSFRGKEGYRLPLYWHPVVQDRLKLLAKALGMAFDGDPQLKLVYVTQMTTNGIEGHLQGVDLATLVAAGYTDARWIEAGEAAARGFASAFPNKAIAFEVHEVNGAATVPEAIINDLWNDPTLGQRVGAGMWWISGKTIYQPQLLEVLADYPGDIYGQVIGRSDQARRFPDGDYVAVFAQARKLGLRYIEPWEFEFKRGGRSADGKWDKTMAAFNAWADERFGATDSAGEPAVEPSTQLP